MRRKDINKQKSGIVLGFIVGLIVGLIVAVMVAMVMTRTPMPFHKQAKNDKLASASSVPSPAVDPNQSLYGKGDAAKDVPKLPEDIPPEVAAKVEVPKPDTALDDKNDKTIYFLQAGVFKEKADADEMKAKLALLGFGARVTEGKSRDETSTAPVYRVRIGPLRQAEMNQAQGKLSGNGVDASVIRVQN